MAIEISLILRFEPLSAEAVDDLGGPDHGIVALGGAVVNAIFLSLNPLLRDAAFQQVGPANDLLLSSCVSQLLRECGGNASQGGLDSTADQFRQAKFHFPRNPERKFTLHSRWCGHLQTWAQF